MNDTIPDVAGRDLLTCRMPEPDENGKVTFEVHHQPPKVEARVFHNPVDQRWHYTLTLVNPPEGFTDVFRLGVGTGYATADLAEQQARINGQHLLDRAKNHKPMETRVFTIEAA